MFKETLGLLEQNSMSTMEKKMAIETEPALGDLIQRPLRLVGSFLFILIKLDPVPVQAAITK